MTTHSDWLSAIQQAQANFLQQWAQAGAGWMGMPGMPPIPGMSAMGATAAAPGAGGASAAGGADLARQIAAQFEQALGFSNKLWQLYTQSAASNDIDQRLRSFNEGLTALSNQLVAQWTSSSLAQWPAMGPARSSQQQWQRLNAASGRWLQAQSKVGQHWAEVLGSSLKELGEQLGPKLRAGAAAGDARALYDQWVNVAESAYARAAHGAQFVAAQAELTNAMSEMKLAQREVLEEWARQFDLPTRAEINALHEQIRELRAELRKLTGG